MDLQGLDISDIPLNPRYPSILFNLGRRGRTS